MALEDLFAEITACGMMCENAGIKFKLRKNDKKAIVNIAKGRAWSMTTIHFNAPQHFEFYLGRIKEAIRQILENESDES